MSRAATFYPRFPGSYPEDAGIDDSWCTGYTVNPTLLTEKG